MIEIRTALDHGMNGPFPSAHIAASLLGADDLTPIWGDPHRLKGTGGHRGGPVGHRKNTLLHGDGCSKHEHCESCPFPECRYQECTESMKRRVRIGGKDV